MKRLFRGGKVHPSSELFPDEVFVDSSNLPAFNKDRLEGRMEYPIRKRTLSFLLAIFLVIVAGYAARLADLQVVRGEEFATLSEQNRLRHSIIIADRGAITDRNGVDLAWNEPSMGDFPRRRYTTLAGLSHLLGYVSYPKRDSSGFYFQTEIIGVDGVERSYQSALAGHNGLKIVETDARGSVLSESTIELPRPGMVLPLSIDAEMTQALYRSINAVADQVGFTGGAGVLLDVKTGEVLALTSLPGYDPEAMSNGERERIAEFQSNTRKPFLNRAVSGLYAPGSIVKPIVAAAGLTEGVITPTTTVVSTGAISIPNPYDPDLSTVFRDWGPRAWGVTDVRRALAVSSNIFFYSVGGGYGAIDGLGITRIEKYMRMFGLGSPTGIQLPGEAEGVVPSPAWKEKYFGNDPWRLGDTYNTSIGQYGFQVTVLQMARAVAAIASGSLRTPSLVLGSVGEATVLPVPPDALRVVREGMRQSVTEGIAGALNFPEFAIAAKTGTAELGATKADVNSWIEGFFPYEEPRYAFAIVMERAPRTNLVGASAVARSFFEWMYANRRELLGD